MHCLIRTITSSLALALLLSGGAHAIILTNGTADGAVEIDTDTYGSFRSALFNPVGGIERADTTFDSFVYVPDFGGGRARTSDVATRSATIVSASDTELVTNFGWNALNITLTQSLQDSFDGPERVGTVLRQEFRIQNTGVTTSFDVVRYLDGDLLFDGSISDAGGRIQVGGSEILFETDSTSDGSTATTFLGISRTVTGMTEPVDAPRYEINQFSGLRSKIQSGLDLDNTIFDDGDGDGFTDGTYDVTMAQQNDLRILEGQTVVYTTNTLFGNAVPPPPGSIASLPLLPDEIGPDGGFNFNVSTDDVDPFETFFIDPEIATGYTYTITGAEFGSVTAPTLAAVNDPDGYLLEFGATEIALAPGDFYAFAPGITEFRITGIDPLLELDPTDPLAFVTGVSYQNADPTVGTLTITQTPIVTDTDSNAVPAPGSLWLIGLGLAVWRTLGRRPVTSLA
ncbi:MAG: hypothetical protein U5S82_13935 [Gammaproteobacteria bacterium]|nr:hypothetical protein [Gammaproteobacteria bacterium]